MIEYLKDIVGHTFSLGNIEIVKVTGTEDETVIESLSEDRSVIIKAKTLNPIPEFIGTFGMPNLSKLNILLGIPEYRENAKVSVTKKNDKAEGEILAGLHFENKVGDFKNDYRFMTSAIVNERMKSLKFKGAKWNVEFEPTVHSIQRLKYMTQANSEETTFVAKSDKTDLKLYFGDHSSHAGNFVFASDLEGSVAREWAWPVSVVNSILSLPGDKFYRISDEGVSQITVNSGLAEYNYLIPAMQK